MKYCPKNGKQCHKDNNEARAQLRGVKRRTPDYKGSVYFCIYCLSYHIGSLRKNRKDKRHAVYRNSISHRNKKYTEDDA